MAFTIINPKELSSRTPSTRVAMRIHKSGAFTLSTSLCELLGLDKTGGFVSFIKNEHNEYFIGKSSDDAVKEFKCFKTRSGATPANQSFNQLIFNSSGLMKEFKKHYDLPLSDDKKTSVLLDVELDSEEFMEMKLHKIY